MAVVVRVDVRRIAAHEFAEPSELESDVTRDNALQ